MKKIFTILFVFLLTLASVLGAGNLDVIDEINPASGNPETTVSGSFKVKNLGITALSGVVFVPSDLVHTDTVTKIQTSSISFSPASLSTLAAGDTSSVISSNVLIPKFSKPGSYSGSIEVKESANATNIDSFTLTVTVNNFPKLVVETFTLTEPFVIKEEPGETATGTFTIKNEGNVELSNLVLTNTVNTKDNDGDEIKLTFTGLPVTLAPGAFAVVSAKAEIDNEIDFGTYSGSVTVKDTIQATESVFNMDVKAEPRMCSDGVRSDGKAGGDDLRVDIRDPRTSDRFAPGEEMKIKINVRNNGDKDMDVVVSAFLFDLDENEIIEEVETESLEVQDGKSEDFETTLKVPFDVDVNNDFALFVKAFEEDEEDINCGEERRDVELRRERHSIEIKKVIFNPSVLSCGARFDAEIDLQNIGTSDEDDVVVRLFDDELGIDKISNTLSLDKFDKKDDEATIRFRDILVPKVLESKQYDIETIVTFDNGDKTLSKFSTLTVTKCDEASSTPAVVTSGETSKVSVEALVTTFTVDSGKSFSIPVTVTNKDSRQNAYTVEVQNINDFAEDVFDKTLILNPGQSETVYFNVVTKSSTASGKYTASLVVKSGVTVLDTKSVTVNVVKGSVFEGFGSASGSRIFWVVADVILVIVALFFIKMIFGSKRIRREE